LAGCVVGEGSGEHGNVCVGADERQFHAPTAACPDVKVVGRPVILRRCRCETRTRKPCGDSRPGSIVDASPDQATRMAGALQATGDDTLAAEIAGHWAAAGRAVEELPARVRAAEAAERVFGYAEAARHWQRAIELFQDLPDAEELIGIDLPR